MDELYAGTLSMIENSVKQNNAWSAEQAQKQMDFQREMSNTAHVREIADLKAAGLNPVLSAKLGGASSPSGAAASADTSGTSAIASLSGEFMREIAEGFASGAVGAGGGSARGFLNSFGEQTFFGLDKSQFLSLFPNKMKWYGNILWYSAGGADGSPDANLQNGSKALHDKGQGLLSSVLNWASNVQSGINAKREARTRAQRSIGAQAARSLSGSKGIKGSYSNSALWW